MLDHLGTYYVAKVGLKQTVIPCLLNGRVTSTNHHSWLLSLLIFNFSLPLLEVPAAGTFSYHTGSPLQAPPPHHMHLDLQSRVSTGDCDKSHPRLLDVPKLGAVPAPQSVQRLSLNLLFSYRVDLAGDDVVCTRV